MRLLAIALLVAASVASGSNGCVLEGDELSAFGAWKDKSQNSSLGERQKSLDMLTAKYPNAYEIQEKKITLYRYEIRNAWPTVLESYVKRAEKSPKDPLALTLAGLALHRTNTPRAIELLNKARELSPRFPWAAIVLADIYRSGKFKDKNKARTNSTAYAESCGGYVRPRAVRLLVRFTDAQTQATVARQLRARLEADSSPEVSDYEMLWSLEFRSHPPTEHPAIRERVARDVNRLFTLKPDERSFSTLLVGFKQSGASREAMAAFEDRIVKAAPASNVASRVTLDRWRREHKEPEDQADTAAWEMWKRARRIAVKQWAEQFTDAPWIKDWCTSLEIEAGEIKGKEAIRAIEKRVQRRVRMSGPNLYVYSDGASSLISKKLSPLKAYEWMAEAWRLGNAEEAAQLRDDTLTDEQREEIVNDMGGCKYLIGDYLRVMRLAGKKNVPAALRARVEGPMPAKKTNWWGRYRDLAWLALVDGREADALTYFQQALYTRERPPAPRGGDRMDVLLDEAKTAFMKARGTENAFALWSKPLNKVQELAEGRWEKPKKNLPSFDLADLSGKNWKLKELAGKAVLINVWATWCSPCRAELPLFQKLYEKTKDRSDVQVISFNVDDDLGLVDPFLKEQGYTFPALVAGSLLRELLDSYAIPENWLVDPKGNWIATQIGFDASDKDWVNSMLMRLDAAKNGNVPANME